MKNTHISDYEATLLQGWEDVYKKSQLTLWILLSLKDEPKHMARIKAFIIELSGDAMAADDQSMYRALRRFKDAQMIDYTMRAGKKGPDVKQYYLTNIGRSVLQQFIERNVSSVFYNDKVKELINA